SGVCDLLSDLLSTAIGDGPLGQHLPIGDAVSLDLQLPACEDLGAAHTDLESASQHPTWGSQDPTWGSQDPTWGFQDRGWAAAEPGWDCAPGSVQMCTHARSSARRGAAPVTPAGPCESMSTGPAKLRPRRRRIEGASRNMNTDLH